MYLLVEKAERILRQQLLVDGDALVRQGDDAGELQAKRFIEEMAVLKPVGIHNELHSTGVTFEIQTHWHCWQGKLCLHFGGLSVKEGLDPVDAVLLGLGFSVLPSVDGRKRDAEGRSESLLRHSQLVSYCFDLAGVH